MKASHLTVLACLFNIFLFGQSRSVTGELSAEFFPPRLLIRPFEANFLEPRMGFQFVSGENDLRLDIGASKDIFRIPLGENGVFGFGADFFTFTKLRGEDEFHFPVDAVDYLFGVNAGYRRRQNGNEYGIRVRLSHISAHMVDGHFDPQTQTWRDGRKPIVYSREFIEMLPFYHVFGFRVYAGMTYLFHVVPRNIGKVLAQAGIEYGDEPIFGTLLVPFAAYDVRTITIGATSLNHSLYGGVRFATGLKMFGAFQSGKSIHGEYYDVNEETISFGFSLDF